MQAYLDNIKAKTGKTPADFRVLATEKGLTKHSEIIAWLKADFGLGHGHANAIAAVLKNPDFGKTSLGVKLEKVFSGSKSHWRSAFEILLENIKTFAPDVELAPTQTYVSLLRNKKKFAIVQPSVQDISLGLKLKNQAATERLELAGSWNIMVTHRIRIEKAAELYSREMLVWLERAYQELEQ